MWATEGPPSYGALWNLLAAIDAEALGDVLCAAGREEPGISVDGKVLRGSKRGTDSALQVITAAGHRYRRVLAQRDVSEQDMMETVLILLHEMPLEDKIVTLDAGLLQLPFALVCPKAFDDVHHSGPLHESSVNGISSQCEVSLIDEIWGEVNIREVVSQKR